MKLNKIKTFFNNIIKKVKDIWFNKVTKPKLERQKRLDAINAEKAIHKNFEKAFGVSSRTVKSFIDKIDSDYPIKLKQTENNYLNEKLIEGKRFINSKIVKIPFHYDVETVNIHNEYFVNDDGLTLDEVKQNSNDDVIKTFKRQEEKMRFDSLSDKTKRRIKSITRPR